MATMPTPDPNAQTPTPSAPANQTSQAPDPQQQQPSTTPQTPAATTPQDPNSQMVSNSAQSGATKPAQVKPATSQDQSAQSQQPGGLQTQTASTSATLPTQPTKPLPAISPLQPDADHPAVKSASLLYNIATALAGGPRLKTSVDPTTGKTVQTPIPLSRGDISMAIVSSALSGAFSGLGAKSGPGVVGRAGAAGFGEVQQERQQADQQNQDQAQQQFKNQVQATAAQGAATEQNSRTILNTSQSEKLGIENLKSAVDQNSDLLSSYTDAGAVDGTHISQDDLSAGMKSGKYSATDQIAVPDGWTNINGKNEQTFAIVKNPSAKIPLTQDMWDKFAAAGVPGYTKGTKIPAGGSMVPGTVVANGNAQVQMFNQMKQETSSVQDVLSGSDNPAYKELGQGIDLSKTLNDPQNGPPARQAMGKFQKYISHSDLHGMDLYESLKQMSAPSKADPNNPGKFIPNPDAASAQTVAGIFGNGDPKKGWEVLQAFHDEQTPEPLKNRAAAESVLTDPTSSPKAIDHAKAFIATDDQRIAAGKAAKAGTGKGAVDGVAENTLVDQIGTGHIAPGRMAYLLSKNPDLIAKVGQKYQDWDSSKAESYAKTYNDFTSGKTNQQLLSGGVALQHLAQLKQINDANPIDVHNPSSAPYKAYNNLLDTVAGELATFYGDPKTDTAIASKKSTLGGLMNRDAAIKEQASAMGAKMDELEQRWKNAAPSKYYEAPMPGLSDKAKAARASLDPNYTYTSSTQGSGSNSSLNPNPSTPQLHNGQHMVQVTIPGGASQVRDANKNVIGYMQNGQYTPIGGK